MDANIRPSGVAAAKARRLHPTYSGTRPLSIESKVTSGLRNASTLTSPEAQAALDFHLIASIDDFAAV